MGIILNKFSFVAGMLFGVYLVQNYNVPNIHKLANTVLDKAKTAEKKYRKRNKPGSDDGDVAV